MKAFFFLSFFFFFWYSLQSYIAELSSSEGELELQVLFAALPLQMMSLEVEVRSMVYALKQLMGEAEAPASPHLRSTLPYWSLAPLK